MTLDELKEYVNYDPVTGIFTRKKSAGNTSTGSVLGNPDKKGYLKCMILGEYHRLNRLAWFYSYGVWPSMQVDHQNQDKTDNVLSNLRDCGTSANCLNQLGPRKNNVLGVQGVHQIHKTGKFRACCTVKGFKHHLGVFDTAEEASKAYITFKTPLIPERKP